MSSFLTHRCDGFVTMLAPIRDYLRPQDPGSSPLLCATKDNYFTRLPADFDPDKPGFGEVEWIRSEDVNVEHLLDVFMSVDTGMSDIWDACIHFIDHLYWHKPRQTGLRRKIGDLPDDHRSKSECLFELSRLFGSVGSHLEQKQLLFHILKVGRERGDDEWAAETLKELSDTNRALELYEEGIQQVREALEIYEQLGDVVEQADCLKALAMLLYEDKQLDAAEEAASLAIVLFPETGQEYLVCQSHRVLADIYHSMGGREEAVLHFELALGIAFSLNWYHELFWIHCSLAELFLDEGQFNDAHAHIEQAKSHAVEHSYNLGRAMKMQGWVLLQQGKLDDATSEILGGLEILKKLGASKEVGECRNLLQNVEQAARSRSTSDEFGSNGELLEMILRPAPANLSPTP